MKFLNQSRFLIMLTTQSTVRIAFDHYATLQSDVIRAKWKIYPTQVAE